MMFRSHTGIEDLREKKAEVDRLIATEEEEVRCNQLSVSASVACVGLG